MFVMINFIRKNIGIFFVILVCGALWVLNARDAQLEATNQRLEKLNDSKDQQINDLHSKNDDLAASVKDLVTAEQNRKLQDEIKRYLAADKCASAAVDAHAVERLRDAAKSASRVPDNQTTPAKSASGADKPD